MQVTRSKLFVIDPHGIYRRGIVSCLASLPMVADVSHADSPADAWIDPALEEADLVLIAMASEQALGAIPKLAASDRRSVIVMADRWQQTTLVEAMAAGASGAVCTAELTAEALVAQVRAALLGVGVMPPELLSRLVEASEYSGHARTPRMTGLTSREQIVLRLIADGRLIREVASELCYSERTVKMVLSHAVSKLGARSRSQAVAQAVREGLI